ncbi:MAG: hypothetical protein PHO08_15860 [Methylococcales bacterium]|nr:hypothetical protein [Methylococcales bacterium]
MTKKSRNWKTARRRRLSKKLLSLIERVVKENNTLLTERQQLRDEINRLKGEQGKPGIIKANKKKDGKLSSEAERKEANANKDNNESGENSEGKKKHQREPKIPCRKSGY